MEATPFLKGLWGNCSYLKAAIQMMTLDLKNKGQSRRFTGFISVDMACCSQNVDELRPMNRMNLSEGVKVC